MASSSLSTKKNNLSEVDYNRDMKVFDKVLRNIDPDPNFDQSKDGDKIGDYLSKGFANIQTVNDMAEASGEMPSKEAIDALNKELWNHPFKYYIQDKELPPDLEQVRTQSQIVALKYSKIFADQQNKGYVEGVKRASEGGKVSGLINYIKEALSKTFGSLGDKIKFIWEPIKNALSKSIQSISDFFKKANTKLLNGIEIAGIPLSSILAWGAFAGGIIYLAKKFFDWFKTKKKNTSESVLQKEWVRYYNSELFKGDFLKEAGAENASYYLGLYDNARNAVENKQPSLFAKIAKIIGSITLILLPFLLIYLNMKDVITIRPLQNTTSSDVAPAPAQ
jgi:hypothetical protein